MSIQFFDRIDRARKSLLSPLVRGKQHGLLAGMAKTPLVHTYHLFFILFFQTIIYFHSQRCFSVSVHIFSFLVH